MPGAKLWVQRYNGPGNGSDVASSVAVSPGGGTVFVTGQSKGATCTIQRLPDGGLQRRHRRAAVDRAVQRTGNYDEARAVAVSPDGATVFVTGSSEQASGSDCGDYATVAYRASDGTQLWVARFNGPANDGDYATAVSVARDGTTVFVTGTSWRGSGSGIATVAYRASDGAQLWVKSWSRRRRAAITTPSRS